MSVTFAARSAAEVLHPVTLEPTQELFAIRPWPGSRPSATMARVPPTYSRPPWTASALAADRPSACAHPRSPVTLMQAADAPMSLPSEIPPPAPIFSAVTLLLDDAAT